MIKLKNKMEKWNFSSKEDLIIALEGYIIETPLGYCLSGELLEKINSVGKIKTPKIVNDNSATDIAIEEIRNAIYDVVGSHIKTTDKLRYNVTTFGKQGREILAEFIQNTPDELPALIEAIKCYYRDIDVPKAINNFFIEGVYKNYKDFLQEEVNHNTFLLR